MINLKLIPTYNSFSYFIILINYLVMYDKIKHRFLALEYLKTIIIIYKNRIHYIPHYKNLI